MSPCREDFKINESLGIAQWLFETSGPSWPSSLAALLDLIQKSTIWYGKCMQRNVAVILTWFPTCCSCCSYMYLQLTVDVCIYYSVPVQLEFHNICQNKNIARVPNKTTTNVGGAGMLRNPLKQFGFTKIFAGLPCLRPRDWL